MPKGVLHSWVTKLELVLDAGQMQSSLTLQVPTFLTSDSGLDFEKDTLASPTFSSPEARLLPQRKKKKPNASNVTCSYKRNVQIDRQEKTWPLIYIALHFGPILRNSILLRWNLGAKPPAQKVRAFSFQKLASSFRPSKSLRILTCVRNTVDNGNFSLDCLSNIFWIILPFCTTLI